MGRKRKKLLPAPGVFLVAKWIGGELDRESPLPCPRVSQAPNTFAHAPASGLAWDLVWTSSSLLLNPRC